MSKIGNKSRKAHYDSYKNSGRKLINKQKKAERHKKRMEKFAKRKESGNAYEYKNIEAPKGTKEYDREKRERAAKNKNRGVELSQFDSIMKKLDNRIRSDKERKKKEEQNKK